MREPGSDLGEGGADGTRVLKQMCSLISTKWTLELRADLGSGYQAEFIIVLMCTTLVVGEEVHTRQFAALIKMNKVHYDGFELISIQAVKSI